MRLTIDSCFVAYILPSSGIILAIYYKLYGLCLIRTLDGRMFATKNNKDSWLNPPPMSLETFSFLYLLYISVVESLIWALDNPNDPLSDLLSLIP